MAELKIEIPEDLEADVRELSKDEIDRAVHDALKERLSERLMFKVGMNFWKTARCPMNWRCGWAAR